MPAGWDYCPQIVTASIQEVEYVASSAFALTDAGKMVRANSASPLTLTIPTNASVPFEIGTLILGYQAGVGVVSIDPDTGVTVNSPGGLLDTSAQYAQFSLFKRDTDEWLLTGSLA